MNMKNQSRGIIWIIRDHLASNLMFQNQDDPRRQDQIQDRLIVKWVKLSNSTIRSMHSFATTAANLITWHATALSHERWTSTVLWEKLTKIYQEKMISRIRKKTNLRYSRCEGRWDKDSRDRCLQVRR